MFSDSAVVIQYANALNGLNKEQALLALSYKNLSIQQKEQILSQMGLIASENTIQSELLQTALAQKGVSKEKANAIMIDLGLMNSNTLEAISQANCTKADLEAMLAQHGITGAQAEGIISALGLAGANAGLTVSFGLLGKAIWSVTKALLTNPWTWAIVGVVALVAGISKAITTTKEYREKLEDIKSEASEVESELSSLNSELGTTRQRMEELEGKGSLTFTEKEEYDNLVKQNNELQRSIDLLKLEAKTKNKEKNKTFIDTMNSDVHGSGEYTQDSSGNILKGSAGLYGFIGGMSGSTETYSISSEDAYINQQFEERQKLLEEKRKAETKEEKERIQSQIDEIDTYLQSKSAQWSSDAKDIAYISNPTTEDDKAVNAWLDYIADFQDRMAIAMGGDNAKTNTFNRVVDNWQFDETVQGLQDLGKEGKVTAEMLNDPKYDEFINKLVFLGVIDSADNLEDVALAFNSVADSAENAANSASQYGDEITVSLSDLEGASDKIKTLGSAFKELSNDGYITIKTLSEIQTATGISGDKWEEYKTKLLNAKAGSSEFNQIMSEMTYKILDNVFAGKDLTAVTEDEIEAILRENGVTNASAVAKQYKAKATLEAKLAEADYTDGIDAVISTLGSECKALGLTEQKVKDLATMYASTQQAMSEAVQSGAAGRLGILKSELEGIKGIADAYVLLGKAHSLDGGGYDVDGDGVNDYSGEEMDEMSAEHYKKYQTDRAKILAYANAVEELNNIKIKDINITIPDYSGNKTGSSKNAFDWIETKLSRIQRTITNLGKTVSATYKQWSTRNNALVQEMSAINQEIATQQQAMDAYMAKANSVGLPEPYKTLVEDGGLRIDEIADEALKEQIQDYQEWYNKAIDCSDAIQDLQDSLAELAKTKFDNISKQYDDSIAMIEHHTSMLEGYINRAETAGFWASEVYYQKMAEKELENINQLQSKYNDLTNTLNESVSNGFIEQYSEDWYEMRIDINDVEQALQQANTQLVEFNQTLQQIRWDIFDRASDYKDLFIEESNFLAELISRRDLYNEVGNFTADGLAVQGLHAVNYNAYMEQSEAYAKEILKLNEEIANDPNDLELIDRRNELIGLQQEAIKSAMSEKDAIKDLISDGYDTMLDSLNNLIDKRKEALNAERDLFDYQNSIQEKTDTISSYQKQLQAYAGNNSEEAKATIQKLQVSLAEAEKDLRETEYDKWMSDQESMLDNLYNQTEQWINTRLDDINGLVSEAIQATNNNSATISGVITETAETLGYTLSEYTNMLWSGNNDNTALLLKAYEDVSLGVDVGVTRLETVLNSIDQKIQTMVDDLNNQAVVESESIGQPDIEYNETNNYDDGDYEYSEPPHPTSSGVTFTGGTFYEDSYKGGNTGNSKNQWTGHEVEVTHESGTGMVHIVDKTTGTILGWVDKDQLQGYATGTTNAKKGFNLVSEKGDEIIKDNDGNIILARGEQIFPFEGGETVFNAAKTAELLNGNLMPLNAEQLWGNIVKTPRLPEMMNKGVGGNIANDIQLNIAVKANNFDEFCTSFKTAIKDDPQCRKLLRAVTVDETVGRGGLLRNNF